METDLVELVKTRPVLFTSMITERLTAMYAGQDTDRRIAPANSAKKKKDGVHQVLKSHINLQ